MMISVIIPDEMKIKISKLLWDCAVERVAVVYGYGVTMGGKKVYRITHLVEAENKHRDPENAFGLYQPQLRELAERERTLGSPLMGILHGHPSPHPPEPSDEDLSSPLCNMVPLGGVYHCKTSTLTWYNKKGVISSERLPLPPMFGLLNRIF